MPNAPETALIVDPSTIAPVFLFNTGQVGPGGEIYDPTPPPIPGPVTTTWGITEWSKEQYMNPAALLQAPPFGPDPTYGTPTYSWDTPDMRSAYTVTESASLGNIFDLYSADGNLNPPGTGGACVFLNTMLFTPTSMNQVVNFSMDAKVAQAVGTSTDGYATAESGFTLHYNANGVNYTLFLQFAFSDARGYLPTYASSSGTSFIYAADFTSYTELPFAADPGPLHYLTYNLNVALVSAADYISSVSNQPPSDLLNMNNWTLTGFYVGSEVGTSGGNIGLGVDVASINISSIPGSTFLSSDVAASSNGVYQISTGTTGQIVSPTEGGAVHVTSGGPDTINAGAANLSVNGSDSALTVNGGDGTVVVNTVGPLTFAGSSGAATLNTMGPVNIRAGSGSLAVTAGGGQSMVACGSGNATVTATGSITVWGGSGNLVAESGTGGDSVLIAGTGNSTLTAGGFGDSIFGGGGSSVLNGSTGDMIVAGTGTTSINGGKQDTIFGATGVVVFGGGNDVIVSGAGRETLNGGGSGTVIWTGSSEGDLVNAGSGNVLIAGVSTSGSDTIYGGSGSDTIFAGVFSPDMIFCGNGESVIVAQDGDHVSAGAGTCTITGGSGNVVNGSQAASASMTTALVGNGNQINVGGGTNSFWNTGANTTYIFNESVSSHDIISYFNFSQDKLTFSGYSGNAVSSEHSTGTNVNIVLTNGTQIDILNAVNFNSSLT